MSTFDYQYHYTRRYEKTATQQMGSLDDFCRRYDAKLLDSEHRRARRFPVSSWSMDHINYSPVHYQVEYEQLVALHMPKESLDKLMSLELKLEHTYECLSHYAQKEQEEMIELQVRQNNPAVKKAWETYCTLLALCR